MEQQPIRARMCGFGDKDRRPITPPPCVRLVVLDAETGEEMDPSQIDSSFFVLTVDLWDHDGAREVNLVRHSSGAPTVSISSSTVASYPPPPERPPVYLAQQPQFTFPRPGYPQPAAHYPMPASPMSQYGGSYGGPPPFNPPYQPAPVPLVAPPTSTTSMFTRNLIGSLTVNAFKLADTEQKLGFWFVLQDLSVRTEGTFRYVFPPPRLPPPPLLTRSPPGSR